MKRAKLVPDEQAIQGGPAGQYNPQLRARLTSELDVAQRWQLKAVRAVDEQRDPVVACAGLGQRGEPGLQFSVRKSVRVGTAEDLSHEAAQGQAAQRRRRDADAADTPVEQLILHAIQHRRRAAAHLADDNGALVPHGNSPDQIISNRALPDRLIEMRDTHTIR